MAEPGAAQDARVAQLEKEVQDLSQEVNRLREENRRWAKLAKNQGNQARPAGF